jgi:hypothetical protein
MHVHAYMTRFMAQLRMRGMWHSKWYLLMLSCAMSRRALVTGAEPVLSAQDLRRVLGLLPGIQEPRVRGG